MHSVHSLLEISLGKLFGFGWLGQPAPMAGAGTPAPPSAARPTPAAPDAPSSGTSEDAPAAPTPATVDAAGAAPEPAKKPESVTEAVSETVTAAMTWTDQALNFIHQHVLTKAVGIEVAALIATGLTALALSGPLRRLIERIWPAADAPGRISALRNALISIRVPLVWVLLLWFATSLMRQQGFDVTIVRASASLLNAWVLIRLFSSTITDRFWARTFAGTAWFLAALNILGLLDPTVAFLDSIAIKIGATRLSLYAILKGLLFAGLLLWIASLASRIVNQRITSTSALTPSVQTLISQTVRLGLLFGAVIIALSAIGIDLTALAVFSGAVGVGIGFGLQSVFSNLVAGIILLFERSIKIGDFVELSDGVQGTVREITIRSTLVTTNDNIDILVPNSEFITKQMTNWTLRDAVRRFRIPFGVAYGSDKDLVRTAVLEAAATIDHTLTNVSGREPKVWLVGFGDSSLDFELVVWLKPESVTRPAAVNADYCWAIETALRKYKIEIPFPQRDLHIRSGILHTRRSSDEDEPVS